MCWDSISSLSFDRGRQHYSTEHETLITSRTPNIAIFDGSASALFWPQDDAPKFCDDGSGVIMLTDIQTKEQTETKLQTDTTENNAPTTLCGWWLESSQRIETSTKHWLLNSLSKSCEVNSLFLIILFEIFSQIISLVWQIRPVGHTMVHKGESMNHISCVNYLQFLWAADPELWNNLPSFAKCSSSYGILKCRLKSLYPSTCKYMGGSVA